MDSMTIIEFLMWLATPALWVTAWSTVLTSLTDGDGEQGALEDAFYDFWQQTTTLGRTAVFYSVAIVPPVLAWLALQFVPAETLADYDHVFNFVQQMAIALFGGTALYALRNRPSTN